MKAKRMLSLLLTAALMLSMVTPVLAASAETELPRASQTRLEETNEVVSIRLQAAGKLVYGSPFELSVVTRPADAQYIGVVLGVIISAKLTHQRVLPVLDAFAPAGALLVAIARFGEKYLGEIGTAGFEMPEQLAFFPFALTNEWGESYPAIFMLSCLAALIVAIVGLTRKPGGRDGQLFLRTAFYLALPQIMCESLLAECMKWGFVRVQQLLCALTLLVILIVECRRASGSLTFAKRWWPVGALLLCAAGLVGVEFALDKSGLPAFVGYGAMVVLLALIAAAECGAARRVK